MKYIIDPDEINYIASNLKEGETAIDLGAHKGAYIYWMQRSVRQSGKVYGFEPQKKLFNYLNHIVSTLGFRNVLIENSGMSSKEGEVKFYIPITPKGDSPGARIGNVNIDDKSKEEVIKVTTLDKYFLDQNIIPSLIKIDVEGHEKQVLLGGGNLLKTHKPKIIIECENRHLNKGDIFDVFDILLEIGYSGYYFYNKKLTPIYQFHVEINQKIGKGRFWEDKNYINNFIFE